MRRALFLFLLATPLTARAAPPVGQSAYLRGMHDREAASWIRSNTSATSCDRGWITDLQYIGIGGSPSIDCHDTDVGAGISYIQRLDASGSESIPHDPSKAASFGAGFAEAVKKCPKLHVWVVGNEPNVGFSADVETTTTANAAAYAEVHKAVHAVAGHESDVVLLAPDSPYSPACICSLRKAIQKVKARGVKPDGYAVHAYTQAQGSGDLAGMTSLVTSEAMSGSNDTCGYPFHWQFRIYRDWINAIEAEGEGSAPVFITESGNACAPTSGNSCYPNSDIGYFQALWKEIADWNATAATKVRAITPYRWTKNDDGTGRDFAIGDRPALLGDLKKAFDAAATWTTPATCGGPADDCTSDADCSGTKICDLAAQRCVATRPCGEAGACGAGEICRSGTWDCVPAERGSAKLTVLSPPYDPGKSVVLDAYATIGLTNVAMELQGPSGAITTTWKGMVKPDFHWQWTATLGSAGTHRATFRADPSGKVYGIAYVNVGTIAFPADAGTPGDDASVADSGVDGGNATYPSDRDADDMQGGCGCTTPGRAGTSPILALVAVLALTAARRR